MKKLLLLITITAFLINASWAQSKYLFDINSGLTNTRINDITTDHNGMIWVGTQDGLYIFDGHSFSECIYPKKSITKITLLHNNDILVTTSSGIIKYNYMQSSFEELKFVSRLKSFNPYVTDIIVNDTAAYISTSGFGIYTYHIGDTAIYPSNITQLIDTKYIQSLFMDSKNRIWIASQRNSNFVYYNGNIHNAPQGTPNEIGSFIEDNNGTIYAASLSSGVGIIEPDNTVKHISLNGIGESYPVSSIMLDGGKLYIGTDGLGLWEYDISTKKSNKIIINDLSFDFGKSKIHSIEKDNDGNVWLSAYHKGLILITKESPIFENYFYQPGSPRNVGGNSVGALTKCNGNVWIGTEGDGIYIVESNKNVSHIDLTDQSGHPIMANIICMYNQNNKYIWIGTYNNGFIKIDAATHKTLKIYNIPCEKVSSITQSDNGNLLLTSLGGGIGSFDVNTGEYTQGILINPQWANCIQVDNFGDHWIATYDGLWYVDKEMKTSRKFTIDNGFLNDNTVSSLYIDNKNMIWCATNNGITIINPINDHVKHVIKGKSICSIVKDKMGYVWASCHDGLLRYNPQTDSIMEFGIEDGLKGNEFSRGAGIIMDNGMACFGGTMGITMIKSNKLGDSTNIGKVVLRGITVNNKKIGINELFKKTKILSKNIAETDTIYLSETFSNFAIQFASSNPAQIEQTRFKYRMLGFDSTFTWCAKGVTQASFTNIENGVYTLEIAANLRYAQSPVRRLTIIVSPAWYNTPVIKIIFFIIIALIIFLAYEYYMEKIRRHQSEEINEMKMQFFINISHEIRTPLTLIIDPLEKLLSKPNIDSETSKLYNIMKVNSKRILRLVSQLLDLRKIDKGQVMMKYGKTELCSFVREILESCTPLSDTKEITVNFTNNHSSEIYAWIDPENFEKIMLNLINNAIKFTPIGGEIDIDISQYDNENKIKVTVQDNGIGIKQEDIEKIFQRFYQVKTAQNRYITGTGVGLHLARYLTELHKGKLYAENRKDKQGSRFIVELQMGKKHLPENDIIEEQELMPHETALKPIAKRAQDSRAAQLVNSKKNIFVIDDEESIRHYLYEQLNNEYNVICFENGKLAFDNIITYNPTLIICDIMMPEMDGWTFCRKVKRNFKTSHIPVILLTALGDDKSKAQGIDIGADMYLEKPFNTEILKKIIKNMILNREKVTDNIVQKADAYDIENIELKSQDQILMQKVMQIIKEKISCRDLNVEMLADTIGISRVHLHRKLKDITGLSARDYLKNIRMKQASLLLTDKSLSISEIAYAVGYSNPAHFSASFKAFYGVSPTEYSARSKDDSINTDIQ